MSLIDDTLKKPDKDGKLRWSRTSLTMFTAWGLSIYMALYNLWYHDFNYEVFIAFMAVALGAKVTDAWSKKLSKNDKNEGSNPDTIN